MKTPSYQVGDLVWIRPEWDGDHTLHVVVEWNEDRGYVRPEHWPHGSVVPQELVTAEMLEPALPARPAKMAQNSDGPSAAARERTRA
jgi:hypothetical protein